MDRRINAAIAALCLAVALGLTACSAPATPAAPANGPATPGAETPSDGAAGLRLANGLYDQADGTVMALGVLEWKDLEGGFWAVTGAPESAGDPDAAIAVIANVSKDDPAWTKLAGKTVTVIGTRVEGASVRMAGPEITATSVTEITDTPGIAE